MKYYVFGDKNIVSLLDHKIVLYCRIDYVDDGLNIYFFDLCLSDYPKSC